MTSGRRLDRARRDENIRAASLKLTADVRQTGL